MVRGSIVVRGRRCDSCQGCSYKVKHHSRFELGSLVPFLKRIIVTPSAPSEVERALLLAILCFGKNCWSKSIESDFLIFQLSFIFISSFKILIDSFRLLSKCLDIILLFRIMNTRICSSTGTFICVEIQDCPSVFANGPADRCTILGRVIQKTQTMVLDGPMFNTKHYKIRIKGKWINTGK